MQMTETCTVVTFEQVLRIVIYIHTSNSRFTVDRKFEYIDFVSRRVCGRFFGPEGELFGPIGELFGPAGAFLGPLGLRSADLMIFYEIRASTFR